jgi:hypothetical protein
VAEILRFTGPTYTEAELRFLRAQKERKRIIDFAEKLTSERLAYLRKQRLDALFTHSPEPPCAG